MNDLDRKTVYEFALEGLDFNGFKIKAAFKDIPTRIKLDAIKIMNLDTLQWYKNRLIDIHNSDVLPPSDEEIILYNSFEEFTLEGIIAFEQQWQEEEKLRSMECAKHHLKQ